jgi:hypothetical protein
MVISPTRIWPWRREWDSNPRILTDRRFSRPVLSTAQPSLRAIFNRRCSTVQKSSEDQTSLTSYWHLRGQSVEVRKPTWHILEHRHSVTAKYVIEGARVNGSARGIFLQDKDRERYVRPTGSDRTLINKRSELFSHQLWSFHEVVQGSFFEP